MTDFFKAPILNSPYVPPTQHWELDNRRRPTGEIVNSRRKAKYVTAVPMVQDVYKTLPGLFDKNKQDFDPLPIINEIRNRVEDWRKLPAEQCGVTPFTARLLQHWRHYDFQFQKPFFCQVEAAETAIWLTEVVSNPRSKAKSNKDIRNHLQGANNQANPNLYRIALKLATGAGKTTVMAMLIAWQTVNAVRMPARSRFTRGFLVVAPGITIRDRLSVLEPNHPDNYYKGHELVPSDMLQDVAKAKVVITNFHAFKRREKVNLSAGSKALLTGHGPNLSTMETDWQMLNRVCPELMSMKHVMVINDEAHHCYRTKSGQTEEISKNYEERDEAEKNSEKAHLWISGIESLKQNVDVSTVIDLSATPFFLSGSGYREGTLFPWTVSDFSLLDAIECGVVKLPRVPVSDNASMSEMPRFRDLWKYIGTQLPKKGRKKSGNLDSSNLPPDLENALITLYGHYKQTFDAWESEGIDLPPVFIVVCNNTATSELVYRYIAGYRSIDKSKPPIPGRLPLFSNYFNDGSREPRPRTLLIDSEQIESGGEFDDQFLEVFEDEIERFKWELRQRKGDLAAGSHLSNEELLREVMNTVGRRNRLGATIRCVVSVSMLSEGWDANTVTHILGIRAFGTQLLCEQVVGRALRRQSYELADHGKFEVEYADVFGIPFDFAAEPVVAPPRPPRPPIHVHAIRPDRDHLRIEFPRVQGYAYELGAERLIAKFDDSAILRLTPEMVGPTSTMNQGILGENIELTPHHLQCTREASIAFHLANWLLKKHFLGALNFPKLHLFDDLLRIAREWLNGGYLVCETGTHPSQVLYSTIADDASTKIANSIHSENGEPRIRAVLDSCNPRGTTDEVDFFTSKTDLWLTDANRCHVNYAVCDSSWERNFCNILDNHPKVRRYVKNHGLGFRVPFRKKGWSHHYLPDFIVAFDGDDGSCWHLVVEIKGEQTEDSERKAEIMQNQWIPSVNQTGEFGHWWFLEITNINTMEQEFDECIKSFSNEWPTDFKSMLRIAPLQGIDIDRPRDLGRSVNL